MSSELRQRKGEDKDEEKKRQQMMAQLSKLAEESAPAKSITNKAKVWKDKLMMDPYDLDAMFNLARCYAKDNWWVQTETVLLRGWKRHNELGQKDGYELLMLLADASYKNGKCKQALAVLGDVPEPIPQGCSKSSFLACKARALCGAGDAQKGLATFISSIEELSKFDDVLGKWSMCVSELSKAGVLEPAKAAVQKKAKNEDERKKIDSCEQITVSLAKIAQESKEVKMNKPLLVVGLTLLMGILYYLEQMSLQSRGILN
eukprot:TRINITY_DN32288_c0_g1_i1.p1 TRINITY_DN32288_c0_g1~~TRINITY_DN32288_c0_g1_i1.p1  ORF type:complete len:260 (-),score=76.88 TRINITY_DN32288_c0_g1_i1:218-997(-)